MVQLPKAAMQAVRGFCMGTADIVPGVSGGTIALLFGIYPRLVDNIRTGAQALGYACRLDLSSALDRLRRVEWAFLIPLLVGVLVAVVALASALDALLEDYPEEMAGVFFGLVAASVYVAWQMVDRWDAARLLLTAVVAGVFFGLLGLQSGPVANPSLIVFFGSGAIAICAMILPGISGSFLLLMLGMYAAVLDAVNDRELTEVFVFGVGAVVGLALFSSFLGWVLDRHHDTLMAILVGLLLGSLRVLWPWPNGVGIISEDEEEVIDGTELAWPAADEVALPVILAVVAAGVVIAISTLAAARPTPPSQPAPESRRR